MDNFFDTEVKHNVNMQETQDHKGKQIRDNMFKILGQGGMEISSKRVQWTGQTATKIDQLIYTNGGLSEAYKYAIEQSCASLGTTWLQKKRTYDDFRKISQRVEGFKQDNADKEIVPLPNGAIMVIRETVKTDPKKLDKYQKWIELLYGVNIFKEMSNPEQLATRTEVSIQKAQRLLSDMFGSGTTLTFDERLEQLKLHDARLDVMDPNEPRTQELRRRREYKEKGVVQCYNERRDQFILEMEDEKAFCKQWCRTRLLESYADRTEKEITEMSPEELTMIDKATETIFKNYPTPEEMKEKYAILHYERPIAPVNDEQYKDFEEAVVLSTVGKAFEKLKKAAEQAKNKINKDDNTAWTPKNQEDIEEVLQTFEGIMNILGDSPKLSSLKESVRSAIQDISWFGTSNAVKALNEVIDKSTETVEICSESNYGKMVQALEF